MIKKAYNLIRYRFYTIRAAEWFLSSALLWKNPFYQRFFRKEVGRSKGGPLELLVEPTNLCNLACLMCPHKMMRRKKGIMSNKLFKEMIDQGVKAGVRSVKFAGMGEPLLDRDLGRKIRYAQEKGLVTKMFTNAMPLTGKRAEELIEGGLDELFVSIDGGSAKTLEKIRKGASFSLIQANLKKFNLLRQRASQKGKKIPSLLINVTYQESNQGEKDLIRKKWGGLADEIRFFPIHNWESSECVARPELPCHLLFFQMAVCWDGRVALCCIDYECQELLGDLKKTDLIEIWRGRKFRRVRRDHLENRPGRVPLCRSCSLRPNWFFRFQF